MPGSLYSKRALWQIARSRALSRDGSRCSVARLLGGDCSDVLHVHHLIPTSEGGAKYALENLLTACASHHPLLEALRRHVLAARYADDPPPRCLHEHRTAEARALCEARMARQRARRSTVAA